MIQYTREYLENSNNATSIINEIRPILEHRKQMRDKYTKKNGIPLEAYTCKVATGYVAGAEPRFSINVETNKDKQNIITKLFNKVFGDKANADEFKIMIDYINDYNDLGDFFLNICLDYFSTGACRWLNYESQDNEQVFARVPSWQCELIYDYSTPVQCIGAVQLYQTKDTNGNLINKAIITTEKTKRYFKDGVQTKDVYEEELDQRQEVKWYLVPFYGCESTTGALFENVLDLIAKLEQCINNTSSIMEYNDAGCKLKITGFTPQNHLLNDDGTPNQDRVKEDNALLNAKVFYTPDQSGDINWITKTIDSSSVELMNKTLLEYVLMLTFIPNITDESFTNADSNKALMKKFFGLQTSQQETIKAMQKELLRMWENLTDRINTKKNTKFDFRDIQITINTSIPTDDNEVTQVWMSLRGLLSDETIIEHLPYDLDTESELKKMQDQSEENFDKAVQRAKEYGNENISNSSNNNKLDNTNNRPNKTEEDNTN
ncbi:phage portal protein [bacterium]|nr:phage portal protein [bacterium]